MARRADRAAGPAAMIAAAGLATALLAGCAAGLAGERPAPAGQRVQQVLRAWSAFPATVSPRPLVLAGPRVADPRGAWPDMSARLGPDRRTLTIRLSGAARGTGPCTASYSVRQAASPAAVAVAVQEHAHGGGAVACSAVGYLRHVKVVLPAPLGGRVLVDAASGAAIPVFGAPASAG